MFIMLRRARASGRTPRTALVALLALGVIAALPVLLGATSASAGVPQRTAFAFLSPHIAGAPDRHGRDDRRRHLRHVDRLVAIQRTVPLHRHGRPGSPLRLHGRAGSPLELHDPEPHAAIRLRDGRGQDRDHRRRTVAFNADFFRVGDGATPSFSANVIVSAHDIAPDVPGVQNTWIQGVGCGSALQFFRG